MQPNVNLTEVARRAGVSISTVSRTLNDTGRISEETRVRIRDVMRKMGYRPNRVARRLRSGGSCHLIGLIIPNIQNPFFADLARGVEDRARQGNFAVLLCNYDEDRAKEQFYLDVMRAESVDGIIIPPLSSTDPAVLKFASEGVPVVCVDRAINNATLDKVEVDNRAGACEAVAHLVARGHVRIGMIAGPAGSSTGRARLAGYRDALRQAGLPYEAEWVRHGDYKPESGRVHAETLLSLAEPPTALFAANGLMAIGMLEAIHARGLRIPKQIAVVNFDDLPLASVFNPPLTVVRQPAYEVGSAAAELLLQRIQTPGRAPVSLMLRPELVIRGSS
ncbi:LacI family transcriptional regulator [Opitutaceae bacterium TAV4]|nr:LacI family transcriptional regulator [Opitutaceae bacterium TAV4]RRK02846.1 LacI family transcriptional regulator [Opitutaceae bacterium TAV3]